MIHSCIKQYLVNKSYISAIKAFSGVSQKEMYNILAKTCEDHSPFQHTYICLMIWSLYYINLFFSFGSIIEGIHAKLLLFFKVRWNRYQR